MSTSGPKTRKEDHKRRGTRSAVIDSGNRWNTYKYRGDQTKTKHYSVPTWEKRFCFEVGGVTWKRVTEANRYIHLYDDVMAWNDSAAEKAFDDAKARFWVEINGVRSKTRMPDPYMFIDQDIDWESEIDPELLSGMEAATYEADAGPEVEKVIEVRLEDIVATGWEWDFDNRSLTGMVVGD